MAGNVLHDRCDHAVDCLFGRRLTGRELEGLLVGIRRRGGPGCGRSGDGLQLFQCARSLGALVGIGRQIDSAWGCILGNPHATANQQRAAKHEGSQEGSDSTHTRLFS